MLYQAEPRPDTIEPTRKESALGSQFSLHEVALARLQPDGKSLTILSTPWFLRQNHEDFLLLRLAAINHPQDGGKHM